MSYVLHIWEKPADRPWPSTIDEATKLVKSLHEHPGNPKFIDLVRRLTSRYPDITSPEAEEMPESNLVWSAGPLDGRTDSGVYSIGVRIQRLDEVRAFLVEQARTLGLNVTDQQAGQVFLANGRLLAVRPPVPASVSQDEDVPTGSDLERIVFDRLSPFLGRHGFTSDKTNSSFTQKFAGGRHVLQVLVRDRWPLNCSFELATFSRMDTVSDLNASFVAPERPVEELQHMNTTVLSMEKWLAKTSDLLVGGRQTALVYRLTNNAQIDAAVEHLLQNIETRFLSILEKYKTIEGLDALLNTKPMEDSIFFDVPSFVNRHIIVAYLAKNPRLDAICEDLLSRIQADTYRIPALRCVEYVRREQSRPGMQTL